MFLSVVREPANDLGQFTSLGVVPERKDTLAVKSAHHFRAAFEPIARQVVTVDSGALGAAYRSIPYRRLRRPVWPLDDIPNPPPRAGEGRVGAPTA